MRRLIVIVPALLIAACLAVGALAAPVGAVTYNAEKDFVHDYVGLVTFHLAEPDPETGDTFSHRCSGALISPTVFVTAGHCGDTGDSTTYGTFQGSSFPGNDYAWVATPSHTPVGQVMDYAGGTVAVKGSTQAAVGATVCRSGSTTGWHCGQIQGFNSTVRYAEGSVSGLIRTNVCAEPGDSGGSLLAGNQAQGVTSGGSGDCTSGGTTYFQPVNEILQTYGLRLLTS